MENFFYNGSSLDPVEIEELLLYRYHNIEYILNSNINNGTELINKAIEERDNEKLWQMWLTKFAWMNSDNYMSFNDYRDQLSGKNICKKPKEEIIAEAEEIEKKAMLKRGELNGT